MKRMSNTTYVVILVDKPKDAKELNQVFSRQNNNTFKAEAFSSRTQMVGLQFNGKRPTHIIDAIKDRSHPKFGEWYNSEVLRNAVKAKLIGDNLTAANDNLFQVISTKVGEVTLSSINDIYICEVERLFKMLQDNKFIEPETKTEINLTIQAYMKQIREFHMTVEGKEG